MKILMRLMTGLLRIIYSVIKKFTKIRNKITFISRQSDSMTLDFSLLQRELENRSSGVDTVFLCRMLRKNFRGVFTYPFHMLRQMYHIASSKVVIIDSYSIAVSVLNHKKDLKVIQMWHSIGTMKKFGHAILGSNEGSDKETAEIMRMHRNYDYIFAASKNYAPDLAAGFGYDVDTVTVKPLPRVDLLLDDEFSKKTRSKIYERYPELWDKKNIVYCPTFRKEEDEHWNAINALIDAVDATKFNLIIKLHPLSRIIVNSEKVFTLDGITSFESLFIADYVISDYSCIVYEAGIRNVPIFFYVYDFEEYETKRGMAIDLQKECAGMVAKKPEEITAKIRFGDYDMIKLNDFIRKYVDIHENNSKKIIDFIYSIHK